MMEEPKFLTLEEARAQEEYYQRLEYPHIPVNRGLLQYLKDNQPEIVPERNHYYPPNTAAMEELMNKMIEQTPDGKFIIK